MNNYDLYCAAFCLKGRKKISSLKFAYISLKAFVQIHKYKDESNIKGKYLRQKLCKFISSVNNSRLKRVDKYFSIYWVGWAEGAFIL